jgi:hypothetical protein
MVFVASTASADPSSPLSTRRASCPADGAACPWSPDGRMLAFFAKGKLHKVALDSATRWRCATPDRAAGVVARGTSCSRRTGTDARVSANGRSPAGDASTPRGERGHRYPGFSPTGASSTWRGRGRRVVTWAASMGVKPWKCARADRSAWAPPGWLLPGKASTRRRRAAPFRPGARHA